MDQFNEVLVSPKSDLMDKIATIVMWALVVIACLFLFVKGYIFVVIFGLAAAGVFFLKRYLYIEYEYTYTNGQIDIDAIYEKNNRSKVITFEMKETILLAPVKSDKYKDSKIQVSKVLNAVPTGYEGKVFSAIVPKGENKVEVLMALPEEFVELCFRANPRVVVK